MLDFIFLKKDKKNLKKSSKLEQNSKIILLGKCKQPGRANT